MAMSSEGMIAFSIIYSTIFLISIIGNSCILAAVYKHVKLQTTVNIFLANVALSDIFFTLSSLANGIEFLADEWLLSDVICRIQGTFIEVFYTVSIITLSVIAVERYLIICRTKTAKRTTWMCIKISIIIWLGSFVFCSPLFDAWMASPNKEGKMECYNNRWSHKSRLIFYTIHALFVYFLPLCLMVFTHYKLSTTLNRSAQRNVDPSDNPSGNDIYTNECKHMGYMRKRRQRQRNRRVIHLLITITVIFTILWSPFISIRLLDHAGIHVSDLAWMVSQLLALTSTSVNFVIYATINPDLRNVFRSFLCCMPALSNFDVVSEESTELRENGESRRKRNSVLLTMMQTTTV